MRPGVAFPNFIGMQQGRCAVPPATPFPQFVMPGLVPSVSGLDFRRGFGPWRDTVSAPRCHPGLVPGSRLSGAALARLSPDRSPGQAWTPEQVRGDKRGVEMVSPFGTEPAPGTPLRPTPSCPDLFRVSTSGRRLVPSPFAPRCRETWMAGTSPAMTSGGDEGGTGTATGRRRAPRASRDPSPRPPLSPRTCSGVQDRACRRWSGCPRSGVRGRSGPRNKSGVTAGRVARVHAPPDRPETGEAVARRGCSHVRHPKCLQRVRNAD